MLISVPRIIAPSETGRFTLQNSSRMSPAEKPRARRMPISRLLWRTIRDVNKKPTVITTAKKTAGNRIVSVLTGSRTPSIRFFKTEFSYRNEF